jgi:transcriptional regulator with XRE-family HTH domain
MIVIVENLLIDARVRSGLSRRELARRAGTSQATLSAYEQGRICPSVRVLERILLAAGFVLDAKLVSADELERGRMLEELLDLAEQYPWRERGDLRFPILSKAIS